ncbi:MAG: mannitol dehydrogenase family protein [Pseudobdellovibrionaceae bacterium]
MVQAAQAQTTATTLNTDNLAEISSRIPVPTYARGKAPNRILHMSLGGFHRAHQSVYLDRLCNLEGQAGWDICAVGLMPHDENHVKALQAQDGLYTILERDGTKDTAYVCGSIAELIFAIGNENAVVAQIADATTKIVALTVTEKGYYYNDKGDLDLTHAMVASDLDPANTPKTIYGYLARGLTQRMAANLPVTIMSCDNLPGNGHLTEKLLGQFLAQYDADLAQWVSENVTYPNAMVDRITPVTTPEIGNLIAGEYGVTDQWPVVCESFIQWVLEDKFVAGRPALESVGVQLVSEVDPYEKMKVRLLNGSHSALSYLSYLMGYRNVDDAMHDPLVAKFVRAYMDHDITPTVPNVPGIDLDEYKDTLIARFSNRAISDKVQRLAEDGSTKIRNAILPCIREQMEKGGSIDYMALALAGWFRYLSGVDENGEAIEIKDPNKDALMSRIKVEPQNAFHVLGFSEIFGDDLNKAGALIEKINTYLAMLYSKGAKATLEEVLAS